MEEVWKQVPSFPSYYVSSLGRVRRGTRILAKCWDKQGYAVIVVSEHGKRKNVKVHRMIAEAFHGYSSGLQVDHIDGDRSNNRPENLQWVTAKANRRNQSDISSKQWDPFLETYV